jgi:hypothetical protein
MKKYLQNLRWMISAYLGIGLLFSCGEPTNHLDSTTSPEETETHDSSDEKQSPAFALTGGSAQIIELPVFRGIKYLQIPGFSKGDGDVTVEGRPCHFPRKVFDIYADMVGCFIEFETSMLREIDRDYQPINGDYLEVIVRQGNKVKFRRRLLVFDVHDEQRRRISRDDEGRLRLPRLHSSAENRFGTIAFDAPQGVVKIKHAGEDCMPVAVDVPAISGRVNAHGICVVAYPKNGKVRKHEHSDRFLRITAVDGKNYFSQSADRVDYKLIPRAGVYKEFFQKWTISSQNLVVRSSLIEDYGHASRGLPRLLIDAELVQIASNRSKDGWSYATTRRHYATDHNLEDGPPRIPSCQSICGEANMWFDSTTGSVSQAYWCKSVNTHFNNYPGKFPTLRYEWKGSSYGHEGLGCQSHYVQTSQVSGMTRGSVKSYDDNFRKYAPPGTRRYCNCKAFQFAD